jgi:hypothetical protein
MTRDNILYFSVNKNHIKEMVINFIYFGDDGQFYFSHLIFDSIQYQIFKNSNDKDLIILKGIEKGKCIETENITNYKELNHFIGKEIPLQKLRNLKINKIIN